MKLPNKDSPIWSIIRMAILAGVALGMFTLAGIYESPINKADVITILTLMMGSGGFDVAKKMIVGQES